MNVLEKILEEISIIKTRYESGNHDFIFKKSALCTIVEVESIIRSHMDEVKNDGWIPVSERLPEETGYYLVTLKRKLPNEDYSDRVVVLYNKDDNSFMSYNNLIIAWQPLSKPYKPK